MTGVLDGVGGSAVLDGAGGGDVFVAVGGNGALPSGVGVLVKVGGGV